MKKEKAVSGYWNIRENVEKEAAKYETRKKFNTGSRGAYLACYRNGWMDIIDSIPPVGNRMKRYVYKAVFPDESLYIGLTYNYKERFLNHTTKENSSVYKYMIATGTEPTFELVGDKLYDAEEAAELETFLIDEYRRSGANVLNISRGGTLGGSDLKWTYEIVKSIALNYEDKSEFTYSESGAYNAATRYGWLSELTSHMTSKIKPSGYWDIKQNVIDEACKYITKAEFRDNARGAYISARRHGWLNEVFEKAGMPSKGLQKSETKYPRKRGNK